MFIRYRFLTHKRDQLKLGAIFLLWLIVFCALCIGVYFIHFADVSARTEGMRIHDQLTTKLLLVEQAKELALYYGLLMGGFILLVAFYMLVYSNRLTGPIFKLEKILEKAIHNRQLPEEKVRFRKGDAFQDLADNFNQFVEICRQEDFSTKSSTAKRAPQ